MLYYHFECIIPLRFFPYYNIILLFSILYVEKFQKFQTKNMSVTYFCMHLNLQEGHFFNSIDFSFEMWIV